MSTQLISFFQLTTTRFLLFYGKYYLMEIKGNKKRWIALGTIIVIIVVVVFSFNLILGSIARRFIDNQLETINSTSNKKTSIGKIHFNIWRRTLTLKNIRVVPDSSMFDKLKQGKLDRVSIMKINIPVLEFRKLGIRRILAQQNLSLDKILVHGIEFTVYQNEGDKEIKEGEVDEPAISLDSIQIKKLNGINLSNVEFELFSYTTINVKTSDTIFSFHGNNFEIRGLELAKTDSSGDFFRVNTKNLSLTMQQQKIDLRNANYFVSLGELNLLFSDSLITAGDFMIKPTRDKYKLGASYKYTKEVIGVEIKSINFFGYKFGKAFRKGVIDIDSILIDGMKIDIYKDRTKPFDTSKRPLFIQQQLKTLGQPLHIKNVRVSNGSFTFALRPEGKEKLMKVDISNINADVDFVTSVSDSLQLCKELQVNLNGILMGASTVSLHVNMPYNSPVDTFYFSGELGSGNFKKFNQALYPVTGIKFNAGRLNSLKFHANASPKAANGTMTMLYENLEAEIPKKDNNKKNKFLSFTANTVLRTSNPSKSGKTRVALAKTERVEYKGFGNLLWKTVQSGLINTILPTGKTHKEEAQYENYEKKASPEKNKEKRKDRKE